MRFNIISNITNGAGLQRDYLLLKERLEERGHEVQGVMFDSPEQPHPAHVNVFLEVVTPRMLGERNWIVPNPEWWFQEVWDQHLHRIEKVICKTADCYQIFSRKIGAHRCILTGFESNDFYQPSIQRKPTFLHMAGKSETKNTAAVMGAWKKHGITFPLTVVASKPNIARLCREIPNVTHLERVTDEHLTQLMNENIFHVMPSKYEGFGHYIHEAIGCGGLVITTDGAPMNQFNGVPKELLIQSRTKERMREAVTHIVSEGAVAAAVNHAATLSDDVIAQYSATARQAFLDDREAFRVAFGAIA